MRHVQSTTTNTSICNRNFLERQHNGWWSAVIRCNFTRFFVVTIKYINVLIERCLHRLLNWTKPPAFSKWLQHLQLIIKIGWKIVLRLWESKTPVTQRNHSLATVLYYLVHQFAFPFQIDNVFQQKHADRHSWRSMRPVLE